MSTTEDKPQAMADEPSSAPVAAPLEPVAIDWQHLPKSICKGLVLAQGTVRTVENDGKIESEKRAFKFPTAAAISEMARKALSSGDLAIQCTGWVASANAAGIRSDWIIMHADGSISPTITLAMPMATGNDRIKAVGATMSYTRKYFLASLLNMGWVDPREEVETMTQPRGQGGGNRGGHRNRGGQNRGQQGQHGDGDHSEPPRVTERTTTKAPAESKPAEKPPSDELKAAARESWKALVALGVHPEMIHCIATGITGGMPEVPSTSELRAIVYYGNVARNATALGREVPKRYEELRDYVMGELPTAEPVQSDGKNTATVQSNGHDPDPNLENADKVHKPAGP